MKLVKRTLTLAIAIVMVMAVFTIPASAATISDAMVNRIGKFRQISQTNYVSGYASAAQSILYGYDLTHNMIEDTGKVDGRFGSGTKAAVEAFQNEKKVGTTKGTIDSATWKAMAEIMETTKSGSTTLFWVGTRHALDAVYSNSVYEFYYRCTEDSIQGENFHDGY